MSAHPARSCVATVRRQRVRGVAPPLRGGENERLAWPLPTIEQRLRTTTRLKRIDDSGQCDPSHAPSPCAAHEQTNLPLCCRCVKSSKFAALLTGWPLRSRPFSFNPPAKTISAARQDAFDTVAKRRNRGGFHDCPLLPAPLLLPWRHTLQPLMVRNTPRIHVEEDFDRSDLTCSEREGFNYFDSELAPRFCFSKASICFSRLAS